MIKERTSSTRLWHCQDVSWIWYDIHTYAHQPTNNHPTNHINLTFLLFSQSIWQVMELEIVCEDEVGERRISQDQNPAINSSTKQHSANSSIKKLRRKDVEKTLGLDDTVLEDNHDGNIPHPSRQDLNHKVAATVPVSSSALPPPGMNLFTNPKAISSDTATPGLAAKLEQLFSQQLSNTLSQLQEAPSSVKNASQSVLESPLPDTSSAKTTTLAPLSTPSPVNKGNGALLFSRCSLQLPYRLCH